MLGSKRQVSLLFSILPLGNIFSSEHFHEMIIVSLVVLFFWPSLVFFNHDITVIFHRGSYILPVLPFMVRSTYSVTPRIPNNNLNNVNQNLWRSSINLCVAIFEHSGRNSTGVATVNISIYW